MSTVEAGRARAALHEAEQRYAKAIAARKAAASDDEPVEAQAEVEVAKIEFLAAIQALAEARRQPADAVVWPPRNLPSPFPGSAFDTKTAVSRKR